MQDAAGAVRHSDLDEHRAADARFPATVDGDPGRDRRGPHLTTVWAWEGNNVDGPIAAHNGAMLFANNDAGNVMRLDPVTGLAEILHDQVNTAGAVSRSKNGALFVAERGLPEAVVQLEPSRKLLANTFNGEPLECVGGVINDIAADSRGGVYMAVSGGGLLYADPAGRGLEIRPGRERRQRASS